MKGMRVGSLCLVLDLAALSSLVGLVVSPAGAEVRFSFTRVVDTDTPMPGLPGSNFQVFLAPAIDQGRVAFIGGMGGNGWPARGLFKWQDRNLSVVADWRTIIPNGPWTETNPPEPLPFGGFGPAPGSLGWPAISGDNVAFAGGTPYTPGDWGIYKSTSSGLSCVAHWATPIPGTSDVFFGYNVWSGPSISGDDVAFTGANNIFAVPRQGGVYLQSGGALSVVADVNTPVPGGTGNFTLPGWEWPGRAQIDGSEVAFSAETVAGRGIYKFAGGNITAIADTSTAIPGGGGNFTGFGTNVSIDRGDIVFSGDRGPYLGHNGDRGIYLSHNGALQAVATVFTPTPGHEVYGLGPQDDASIDNGNVVFTARCAVTQGLYTTLGGQLIKVLDTTDTLDGRSGGIQVSPQAISGDQIAFVMVSPDYSGVYVASRTDVDTVTVECPADSPSVTLPGTPRVPWILHLWLPTPLPQTRVSRSDVLVASDDLFLPSDFGFTSLDFPHAGAETVVWDLSVEDAAVGSFTIEFTYDPALVGPGVAEEYLRIYHYSDGEWIMPPQSIDLVGHVITVDTESLSPFALGAVPEPAGLLMLGIGAARLLRRRRAAG